MTLLEMEPYITGRAFTRKCQAPARCTPEMFSLVCSEAAASDTCAKVLEIVERYQDFEPDISNMFPKSEREEMFYCLKNNGYSPNVPGKCIYLLKTLTAKYGSASLALKALPNAYLTILFQKNYLEGCTVRDVIKSFADPEYEPFTPAKLRIQHKDYDEIYVASEDMVALVPKDISAKIADSDIPQIELGKKGLEVSGLELRFMANHYGAINSFYDLRELI